MTNDERILQDMKRLGRALGCSIWPESGPTGFCPWQAEGRIALPNQKPVRYYFRARGTHWAMGFHKKDPYFHQESFNVRRQYSEEPFSAGHMKYDECLDFITQAILIWKENQGKGLGDGPIMAPPQK